MSRGGSGGHTRVLTARKRTAQSTRWLERQLNDPYVKRAKAEGYRSRAAYKLTELDERSSEQPAMMSAPAIARVSVVARSGEDRKR